MNTPLCPHCVFAEAPDDYSGDSGEEVSGDSGTYIYTDILPPTLGIMDYEVTYEVTSFPDLVTHAPADWNPTGPSNATSQMIPIIDSREEGMRGETGEEIFFGGKSSSEESFDEDKMLDFFNANTSHRENSDQAKKNRTSIQPDAADSHLEKLLEKEVNSTGSLTLSKLEEVIRSFSLFEGLFDFGKKNHTEPKMASPSGNPSDESMEGPDSQQKEISNNQTLDSIDESQKSTNQTHVNDPDENNDQKNDTAERHDNDNRTFPDKSETEEHDGKVEEDWAGDNVTVVSNSTVPIVDKITHNNNKASRLVLENDTEQKPITDETGAHHSKQVGRRASKK